VFIVKNGNGNGNEKLGNTNIVSSEELRVK
jgi:hypothetical protein